MWGDKKGNFIPAQLAYGILLYYLQTVAPQFKNKMIPEV